MADVELAGRVGQRVLVRGRHEGVCIVSAVSCLLFAADAAVAAVGVTVAIASVHVCRCRFPPLRTQVVQFVGDVHYAAGTFVGVQLDDAAGKNNGTVKGTSRKHRNVFFTFCV